MDNKVTGKELMEALIVITPWIADILQVDIGFAVTDKEKFIIQKKLTREWKISKKYHHFYLIWQINCKNKPADGSCGFAFFFPTSSDSFLVLIEEEQIHNHTQLN